MSAQESQEWTLEDVKRLALQVVVGLLVLAAGIYVGDWAVWKVRVGRGSGMGSVMVGRFVVAPLKGGKEEYYADGMGEVPCSRSLFPQGGAGACWWLRKNPVTYER